MFCSRRIAPNSAMNSFCAVSPTIGDAERERGQELGDLLGVLVVVVAVGLEQHDAAGVLVAEQGDGVVGLAARGRGS